MIRANSVGIIFAGITVMVIGSLTIIQHPVFAPRGCGGCIKDFQIITRSFGANAGKIILSEHSFPISHFIQLNVQFEKNIIKAFYQGHATRGDPVIPDLVNEYGNGLIGLHPPDSVIRLLRTYQTNVLNIFFSPI